MAGVGLSRPYYAKYSNTGSTVTYSTGGVMGKFTEFTLELEGGDANILYADNGAAESDMQFAGGTANFTTDDLLPDIMEAIFGLTTETITDEGITTATPEWLLFDDTQAIPYLGVGGIIKKITGGATKWQAFVLPKVQFANPGIEAVTQGETIEWQTPSISATVMRSDAEGHRWFMLSSLMDSEADAETAIKKFLSITE